MNELMKDNIASYAEEAKKIVGILKTNPSRLNLSADEAKKRIEELEEAIKMFALDTNNVIAAIKLLFKPGTRVSIIRLCDDVRQYPQGTLGTVAGVDDMGTIHTTWDNFGSLGITFPEDKCSIVLPRTVVMEKTETIEVQIEAPIGNTDEDSMLASAKNVYSNGDYTSYGASYELKLVEEA